MKLELKHLAGYLPYVLMGKEDGNESVDKLLGIYGTGGHSLTLCCRVNNHNTVDYDCTIDDFKPILRPLSDLTKEIEVDGVKFVPIDRIAIYGSEYYLIEQIKIGMLEVIVWQMLLEWHFDIYGLIEADLAIDINTLNN